MMSFYTTGKRIITLNSATVCCTCPVCAVTKEFYCTACEGEAGTLPAQRVKEGEWYWLPVEEILLDGAEGLVAVVKDYDGSQYVLVTPGQ